MRRLRQIISAADFDVIAEGVFGNLARVHDLLEAVEWNLARESSFEEYSSVGSIAGRPLLALKTPPGRMHVAALFLFTIEEETVYLHSVIAADDDDTF